MNREKITSLQNPLVKEMVKLGKSRKYRLEKSLVIIEGTKLIHEICAIADVETLFYSNEQLLPSKVDKTKCIYVTEEIIKKISGTVTPEGVIASFPMPPESSLKECHSLLVLDGVQDPGNVGTLARTALAFGWKGLFCLEGTCDVWNDKALRASRGALFTLPYRFGSWEDLQEVVSFHDLTLYAAGLEGSAPESIEKNNHKIALILGNEGQGLSSRAKELCHQVMIPMKKEVESLNVSIAGALLMYLLRGFNE